MSLIPIDLCEQVEHGNCLLVAGPGVAIPAAGLLGPPGPALLALELAYRLGSQLEDYTLPWVAQYYADRNGLNSLREYVGGCLDDVRYRPTPAHHLIAQLPVKVVIDTAQDVLLREAYRQHAVKVNYVLHSESLAYGNEHQLVQLIQLYGSAEDMASLRLTEDECRQVFDNDSALGTYLLTEATTHALLFLGFSLNDRSFRDFFYQLRPQNDAALPRAYLVDAGADPQDIGSYWQQHNASILPLDTLELLQGLVGYLQSKGGLANLDTQYPAPPPIDAAEQQRRQQTYLEFGRRLGLGREIESGQQLQPLTSGMQLMRQLIVEHVMGNETPEGTPQDQPDVSREAYNAQLQLQQGNIEWAEGSLDRARECFESSIQLDAKQSAAYLSLYYLLVEMGEFDEALRVYQQFLPLFPEQALLPARYQIQKIVGESDLGVTYVVNDSERNEPAAVTILHSHLAPESEELARFVREVGKIQSPLISRLLGCDRYHTHTYLVAEYIAGDTLSQRLASGAALGLEPALQIAEQVALALEDGHRQGVPHLSLAPGNIVLAPGGVRLVNYAFSRLARGRRPSGYAIASASQDFAAPEQRAGDPGDARSDIYALGTILYAMLTGRTPAVGTYQQISEIFPQAGEAVDLLIAHAREMDPARRFQTSVELRMEIQRITLASRQGWPAQYLRHGLALLSDAYTWLYAWPGILAVLLVAALEILAEFAHGSLPTALSAVLRGVALTAVFTPISGALGYYVVRDAARRQGLGSLIASGRSIGVTLGFLWMVQFYRAVNWGSHSLGSLLTGDFALLAFLCFLYVVAMTLVGLGLIMAGSQVAVRFKSRYTVGFYYSYLAVCGLLVLMALFKVLYGIASP